METTHAITAQDAFIHELEAEAVTTRKFFDRVPEDKFEWRPHDKSMTIRQLVTHIAEIPSWIGPTLNTKEMDFANYKYEPAVLNNKEELFNYFEKILKESVQELKGASEEQLQEPWTMRSGDHIISQNPRWKDLRGILSQIPHHRAQLGVYYRLLDIPLPGSYGPSADDPVI